MGVNCILLNRKTRQHYGWGIRYYHYEDEESLPFKVFQFLKDLPSGQYWEILRDDMPEYAQWHEETEEYLELHWIDITDETNKLVKKRQKEKNQQLNFKKLEKLIRSNSKEIKALEKKIISKFS